MRQRLVEEQPVRCKLARSRLPPASHRAEGGALLSNDGGCGQSMHTAPSPAGSATCTIELHTADIPAKLTGWPSWKLMPAGPMANLSSLPGRSLSLHNHGWKQSKVRSHVAQLAASQGALLAEWRAMQIVASHIVRPGNHIGLVQECVLCRSPRCTTHSSCQRNSQLPRKCSPQLLHKWSHAFQVKHPCRPY